MSARPQPTAGALARGVLGLDVGGVGCKAALAVGDEVRVAQRALEVWRAPDALPAVVAEVLDALTARDETSPLPVAVAITAELSDAYADRREGIGRVLDAVVATGRAVRVYATDGRLLSADDARAAPLAVAAANWHATATLVAREHPDAILLDVGSTTTDVIPLRDGRVAARGRTDLQRLRHRELVYTGALRTNAATIAPTVPVDGDACPVASELFATSADIRRWLGQVAADEVAVPSADGRDWSRARVRGRLSRLVCSDAEELSETEVTAIARSLHRAQVTSIATSVSAVAARFPTPPPVVVVGSGAGLADEARAVAGFAAAPPPPILLHDGAAAVAPAVALSVLAAPEPAG